MTTAFFPDLPVCILPELGASIHIWPASKLIQSYLHHNQQFSLRQNCLHKDTYHYTEYAMLLTQEYVSSYHAELAVISQRWEEERRGEERWYDNWRTAVQKVKELYA